MANPVGIEKLSFTFEGGRAPSPFAPVLIGVVGSGNLEVMLQAAMYQQITHEYEEK